MSTDKCHCGTLQSFEKCCGPIISKSVKAISAEELMRSRYSAYATHNAAYLVATTVPHTRALHPFDDILQWAKSNTWLGLEIIESTPTIVEFKAYYKDAYIKSHIHHERSTFVNENGDWFYVNGVFLD